MEGGRHILLLPLFHWTETSACVISNSALIPFLASVMQPGRKITERVRQDCACCPPTHVLHTARLGYLSRPAGDSHTSEPRREVLCTLTGAAGRSKARIVYRNNVPPVDAHANTHARSLSNLDVKEHTRWHVQTPPLLSTAHQQVQQFAHANTHAGPPLTRSRVSSDLQRPAAIPRIIFSRPHAAHQWVFNIGGIPELFTRKSCSLSLFTKTGRIVVRAAVVATKIFIHFCQILIVLTRPWGVRVKVCG